MKRKIIPTLFAAAGALLLPLVFAPPGAQAAVTTPIRANANGPALTDGSGNAWSADKAYSSGSWGYDTLYGSGSTPSAIAGTSDDAIYQTYDLFNGWSGYKFDLANGTYSVTLRMVEDWANAAGQRKFDVRAEGANVLTGFDIFASCGALTACDRTFTTTVSDGQLNVQFNMNGGGNYATVSGIEVTGGTGGGDDKTPPTAPTGLTVTGTTTTTASLSWTASTDNVGVTGYDIYRGTTLAGTSTTTTFTDTGLTANTSYAYTVKARDAAQNVSPASNQVTATTKDGGGGDDKTPPTAPTGLTVTGTTTTTASLSWTASTDNVGVTGYDIYRGTTLAGTSTTTTFTDTGLTANTSYAYTVKARDAAQNVSPASNQVTATTKDGGGGGDKKLLGYFIQWGVYGRNYHVKNVETSGSAAKLTHINYAFGNVTNGQCAIGDGYADYDKAYDAAGSVDGVADTWDQPLRGNFNQLRKLKAKHPGLKVLWSFGGWTWSGGFGQAAANPTAFANSCYNLVNDPRWAGVFDGIDIDWEYPNACGLSCDTSGSAAFKNLMSALRAKFGPNALVTAAITADATSGGKLDLADYAGAAQYVDWYNVMTYDFFGAWDAKGPTAPHSPLTTYPGIPKEKFDTESAIQKLRDKNVPASKLLLGIGFYGRGWTGVTQATPGGTATGPAPGTYEQGIEDYKVLKTSCPSTGTIAGTAYAKCGGNWWSYDTPSTISGKMSYAKNQSLGGSFFWELSGDTANGELITAMKNGLG
ncbi:fibronectin type III domain-containing protein [Microtetraspora sp. AC03309]|uniref:glycosyl hydrolase family 18 protein n=1 Tax=Microtetraspora sp. AC03309 TaxID=2779376 RepID=UPI001E36532D|nr:glycosyl hydrolase family 18 protein [Microtetraspora sp. AC03309]MCC5581126.1 fibronectin type III domain-containing protein [Microtetraspora sp. AC03309]